MVNLEKYKDLYNQTYYTITHLSIKKFWRNIKRWVSYYNIIRKSSDFDYTSILKVEKYQIEQVKKTILKYHDYVGYENDIRYINLALKLLDIVLEDGCTYTTEQPTFIKNDKDEYVPNPKHKYLIPVYVNIRNYKRFLKKIVTNHPLENLYRDFLRIEKAWYLYNQIREKHLRKWWI